MNENGAEGISFDVTLNGFGRSRNLLKLAFEPPALAMTLTILAAALLVVIHALGRFGAPRGRERVIAFGKRALIDNGATMVRMARRESARSARAMFRWYASGHSARSVFLHSSTTMRSMPRSIG